MIPRPHVEIISDDKLTRHAFGFYLMEAMNELILDDYFGQTRPSIRHKFRTVTEWHRLSCRRGTGNEIARALVPLSPTIAAQARAKFLAEVLGCVEGELQPLPEYVYTDALTPHAEPWGICGVFPKALVDAAPRNGVQPVLSDEHIIVGIGAGWEPSTSMDEAWLTEAAKRMKGWIPPEPGAT